MTNYYYRSCPKCQFHAEKYYYIGMNFYWKCVNNSCPVLDIDNPSEKKQGWVDTDKKEETKTNKIEVKSTHKIVDDDDFWGSGFLNKITDFCESLGFPIEGISFYPDGKYVINSTKQPSAHELQQINAFIGTSNVIWQIS